MSLPPKKKAGSWAVSIRRPPLGSNSLAYQKKGALCERPRIRDSRRGWPLLEFNEVALGAILIAGIAEQRKT
jgi:hypothetical protein